MANRNLFLEELPKRCECEELDVSHAFMLVTDEDLQFNEMEKEAHTLRCQG